MKTIQVCGDPTLDWLWAKNPDRMEKGGVYFWLSKQSIPKVSLGSQAGGSVLMYDLIKRMAGSKASVQGIKLDEQLLKEPKSDFITDSWTMWEGYQEKGRSKPSFRICEWPGYEPGQWDYEKNKLSGHADLLMIEDSGMGFRNCVEGWPDALSSDSTRPDQIVIKLSKYNDHEQGNPLITRIHEYGLNKVTTVITAINDLRACPVRIGASLSWEKLFDEIVSAVYSPQCIFADESTGDLKFNRVIVTIGTAGAVIIDQQQNVLIFDQAGQEEDFSHQYQGQLMGYNTCLLGALAAAWTETSAEMDWTTAVKIGVGLSRLLNVEGYDVVGSQNRHHLRFPFDTIIQAYKDHKNQETTSDPQKIWNLGTYCEIKSQHKEANWSILEESVITARRSNKSNISAVYDCAKEIVKTGPRSILKNVPIETVGFWMSADRQEIEGIRSVKNAFRNYLSDKGKQSTPLCIAVFGPPGSGKSFAIKEIAKGLGIDKGSQITFNLSQFESPDELTAAFHQIRDLQLKGKTPLIFWDEFDTPCQGKRLGWLRYFLAPMQDGEFMENGRTRPIGRGIFVFAGATRHSFGQFCDGSSADELAAKKPDFISRLKAYIDVKGPNGNPNTIEDKLFVIRRAFLLNHFIGANAPRVKDNGCFQIEDGVLNAFLRTGKYNHGARSMEALIKMSAVGNKRKYEYSCLPPDQIIGMHTNTREFLTLTEYGHCETMRIGITGHIGLNPAHLTKIKAGIEKAIAFIEQSFPDRYLTVFSPMALGADRLVARKLLNRAGTALIAVLPVPADDYINDFGYTDLHCESYNDAEMRQEFRYWMANKAVEVITIANTPTRDDAYLQTGKFVAENCDLQFTVWDGRNAAGKGGTGDIVALAESAGKPIVHVWAGNFKSDTAKRTDVGDICGTFRYKNIPGLADQW